MSQRILRALMQLFALVAAPTSEKKGRKTIVESLLHEQLNKELVDEYVEIYEQFVIQYNKRKSKSNPDKLLSVSSVKLLTICTLLNEELIQQQKIIVLIKLLEFIRIDTEIPEQAYEFITTVAESFRIPIEEFEAIKNFIFENKSNFSDPERILVVNSRKKDPERINHLYAEGLQGEIYVLFIKLHNLLIFYFEGEKEVYLNQQLLHPLRIYALSLGAALRTPKIKPIYYNDIISTFNYDKLKTKIVFEADKVFYQFKNAQVGTHELSFTERSGRLVGIMGGSGSGKTTLLNLLNGNYRPTSGHIFINGIDLHNNSEQLNGFIGYVAQDDLLIEDLTVFENLFYNAKLCFGGDSDYSIKRKVIKHLKELGLYDIKDMKVGSVLNRKISGGQRKRLNIALELIREPPILFLDEPTSGLSSRDSENIMDLLKDLALKGKLVFVVIHQPSSAIFKMFDRLVVLDQGGYLIYNGQPIESIIYFKSAVREADWSDTVCPVCGNVNPEQIFNIVETRILDEYGNQTQTRKFSPFDWDQRFKKYEEEQGRKKSYLVRKLPQIPFNVPTKFQQLTIYAKRDLLTKLSNLQNTLINLLETPIMALILSFLIKYWKTENGTGYSLYYNENLPVYIFMSVIVAVFVGLSVSAQEIYRDRKILQREAFLNLSRGSYLFSKLFNLFIISSYQSLIFIIIGNKIMDVSFLNLYYWIILFTIWYSSNIVGLIISEAFKSSASIYIIIPFLVIPQIVLSGVLVPFDKLNPNITKPNTIPFFGEIMTAKWAYEALAVKQYVDNPYMEKLYPYDKIISEADYVKDFWINSMENTITDYNKYKDNPEEYLRLEDNLELLRNELTDKHNWNDKIKYTFDPSYLYLNLVDDQLISDISIYLRYLKSYYIKLRNDVNDQKNEYIRELKKDSLSMSLTDEKIKYNNEKLEMFVTNSGQQRIIEYNNRLYRTLKPVFYDPETYFFKAHFYAPTKPFFGLLINTFWFNTAVLWFMIVILYLALYYQVLLRIVEFIEVINRRFKHNKELKNGEKPIFKKRKTKLRKFIKRYS
ncbi:MAG: ATP-binding cassette domain-containing protein [Bacteroidales bacterium]|nr:ATP-binding cassette domain-containing protein [Bacteroidales bacterium]